MFAKVKEIALGTEAQALLEAIRKRGVVSSSLRDAAHEACHALQWGVKKKWTRDNVHAKKPKDRGFGVADEITARAVEQIVCRRLGVDPGPVEQWAFTCWMEMLKNEHISLPTGDWLRDQIVARMDTKAAQKLADQVMALAVPETTKAADPA